MIYLDTSVLVALLANESTALKIRQWYALADTQVFVTSDWTLTEFASALSLKVRTGQLTARQANAVHDAFEILIAGGMRLLEVSRNALRHGAVLVRSMPGLRAGDAVHLAVMLEMGIKEFATLDKGLAEKAVQAHVRLVQFESDLSA